MVLKRIYNFNFDTCSELLSPSSNCTQKETPYYSSSMSFEVGARICYTLCVLSCLVQQQFNCVELYMCPTQRLITTISLNRYVCNYFSKDQPFLCVRNICAQHLLSFDKKIELLQLLVLLLWATKSNIIIELTQYLSRQICAVIYLPFGIS